MDLELLKKNSLFTSKGRYAVKLLNLLADIHGIDRREISQQNREVYIDWYGYIEKMAAANQELYSQAGGKLPKNWEILYDSNYGRLTCLEYNIKRALGMECYAEEIETGISEVRDTIIQVVYYHKIREDILNYGNSPID